MTRLARTVEGQTVSIDTLPKIISNLYLEVPIGAIPLPNGETAYYRLTRHHPSLKKHHGPAANKLAQRMAEKLIELVSVDAFLNHYGINQAPTMPSFPTLVKIFQEALFTSTNVGYYESFIYGKDMPQVERIEIPLGNLVYLRAASGQIKPLAAPEGSIRGVFNFDAAKFHKNHQGATTQEGEQPPKNPKEKSQPTDDFQFVIQSPVLKLDDYITADRLQEEILYKLKNLYPRMAKSPIVVFSPENFKNNLKTKAMTELTSQFGKKPQNSHRKPAILTAAPAVTEEPAQDQDTMSATINHTLGESSQVPPPEQQPPAAEKELTLTLSSPDFSGVILEPFNGDYCLDHASPTTFQMKDIQLILDHPPAPEDGNVGDYAVVKGSKSVYHKTSDDVWTIDPVAEVNFIATETSPIRQGEIVKGMTWDTSMKVHSFPHDPLPSAGEYGDWSINELTKEVFRKAADGNWHSMGFPEVNGIPQTQ